ncbi:MAG: MarR family transcriptional regulator [Deltaproteobacteria bacterium]|nr:MarR family transcriptional regulator [Deltaproteobacteria bacterium]
MAIVRAAESFKRLASSLFRQYDLSFPQYNILRVLDASEGGQTRITEVGRIMLVSGANMTGLAKRLEKNGFIRRNSDPGDERVTLLQITAKGTAVLTQIESSRDQLLENMLQGFSAEDRKLTYTMIRRLLRNIRRLGQEGEPGSRAD